MGYPEDESTWEPIENLQECIDKVIEFNEKQVQIEKGSFRMQLNFDFFIYNVNIFCSELDQIIGCGLRNGTKYFLVRFKGEAENQIIDWETAKQYSVKVMEYFGARLVWSPIGTIIDPERDEDDLIDDRNENNENTEQNPNDQPSTSQPHNIPNEMEYAD